jgi:hypothetical protein
MVMRIAAALAAALALTVPFAADAAKPKPVKAPKSGATFNGGTAQHRKLFLKISGKSVQIVAFKFNCRAALTGNTSLTDIPLTKGKTGYKFAISAHSSATYSDDFNQNVSIDISGKFNRTAKRVSGALRVKGPHCGDTGSRKWYASL